MKKILVILSILALSGCGTLFTGKQSNIALNTSNGKRVKVSVSSIGGMQEVTAPTSIIVKKGSVPVQISVKDKCYEETIQTVPSKMNIVSLANLLFGLFGTTGLGIDAGNGTLWTYENSVTIPVHKKSNCK